MIKITSSNRVMIVGTTGSGKTELVKNLLASQNRVIIIDPKHEFKLEGFKVNKNFNYPNAFTKTFRQILRPRPGRDDERLAEFLYTAYKRRNVTIYCDELAVIEESYPETLSVMKVIQVTGRSRHVGIWNATQRPRNFPRTFMTESEVFFMFRLQSAEDRDYMSGFIGNEVEEKLPLYIFWYYRGDDETTPRLCTLDLNDNKIYPVEVEPILESEA